MQDSDSLHNPEAHEIEHIEASGNNFFRFLPNKTENCARAASRSISSKLCLGMGISSNDCCSAIRFNSATISLSACLLLDPKRTYTPFSSPLGSPDVDFLARESVTSDAGTVTLYPWIFVLWMSQKKENRMI